ncbi:MAG: DUF3892 domain-containing protein [Candidatus Taylorbacteria bacterium CG10_big_fil_rev_8_21_14_0_10_41_48]|uniref:DUF3892 domain-containing protein n=1 Tax=Candidatus Taylorbacteria bacterium CG10_big_fil_rev_8_21_14_0_10_41_48 TaxID=1975024 RepID=A0A2M8LD04_9BACT|nr:MAG: DUF3892 domain-containing protein [Candidatus Taylorbacteria bacterium CG10_big_fil_rev_8_21_14_0_10_41_48]
MTKIRKNHDGVGRDKTYDIGDRKNIPLNKVVKEIKEGEHSGAHLYNFGGINFPRDNPDNSKRDNVNRGR